DKPDWTWGCIAVTNDEIEEIYAMVKNDTLIKINP
ncbi:MAG: L,D-transpeptidase, partial [Roseobacter sp.]